MCAQRAIAVQLRKLASDPVSQTFICAESGCMSGLMALLQAPADVEVLTISMQALLFLAQHPKNKEPLTRQPALLLRLTALAEHDDAHVRSLVARTLEQLQATVNREKAADSGKRGRVEGRRVQRYLHSVALQLDWDCPEGEGRALDLDERARMEKALIAVRAVISVSVSKQGVVTVYTKRDGAELLTALQSAARSAEPSLSLRLVLPPAQPQPPAPEPSAADKENLPVTVAAPPTASSSRALVAHATIDANSLQSRFQAKQKKAVEVEAKQGLVKGLFSSVTSFFW